MREGEGGAVSALGWRELNLIDVGGGGGKREEREGEKDGREGLGDQYVHI